MSAQDVVNPFALACFFKNDYIFGLFDDAYPAFITACVGADWAGFGFGEVVAGFALLDFGFDVAYGLGESEGIGGFDLRIWKASRSAVFEPIPGRRANSSISLLTVSV